LKAAARLPGKALHPANELWLIGGMRNTITIKLSMRRAGGVTLPMMFTIQNATINIETPASSTGSARDLAAKLRQALYDFNQTRNQGLSS